MKLADFMMQLPVLLHTKTKTTINNHKHLNWKILIQIVIIKQIFHNEVLHKCNYIVLILEWYLQ